MGLKKIQIHCHNASQGIVSAHTNKKQPPTTFLLATNPLVAKLWVQSPLIHFLRDRGGKHSYGSSCEQTTRSSLQNESSARRHQNGRWYSLTITFRFYLTSPLPLHPPFVSTFSHSSSYTVNRLRRLWIAMVVGGEGESLSLFP